MIAMEEYELLKELYQIALGSLKAMKVLCFDFDPLDKSMLELKKKTSKEIPKNLYCQNIDPYSSDSKAICAYPFDKMLSGRIFDDEIKFDENGNLLIPVICEGCHMETTLVCKLVERRLEKS